MHNVVQAAEEVLRVSVADRVPARFAGYAEEKIGRALEYAPEPVLAAQVRLTRHHDPAVAKPIIAQVNADVNGRAVRVQVAATEPREAVDLLEDRLKNRLQRLARHWESVRNGRAQDARGWRHGAVPRSPLPYYPRPAEEREVVRHKSFALAQETCDEAAFDMDLTDHDFHLFTEAGSGVDSVLYRSGAEFRLAQVDPRPGEVQDGALEFTTSTAAAPTSTVDEAIERLELTGRPFVFFQDRNLRRGCVLYHRYDGHYGLITPAA